MVLAGVEREYSRWPEYRRSGVGIDRRMEHGNRGASMTGNDSELAWRLGVYIWSQVGYDRCLRQLMRISIHSNLTGIGVY